MAKEEKFTFLSADGKTTIHAVRWIPEDGNYEAILQITHGMIEFVERYRPFADFLTQNAFMVVGHDHLGHGDSVASREDWGYFAENPSDTVITDMHTLRTMVQKENPGVPYFMMGHSMGSLAVRCYLKKYDRELDGLIVCGCPGKNPMAPLGSALIQMLQKMKDPHSRSILADGIFANMFDRPFRAEKLIHAWICSDHTVVEKYNKDPLCNFTFTLNGYESLLWLMRSTYDRKGWEVRNPNLPILFVSGEDDPCLGGRKKLLQAVRHLKRRGYDRVSFRLYPGMRHEILNEKGRFRVYHDIAYFSRVKKEDM